MKNDGGTLYRWKGESVGGLVRPRLSFSEIALPNLGLEPVCTLAEYLGVEDGRIKPGGSVRFGIADVRRLADALHHGRFSGLVCSEFSCWDLYAVADVAEDWLRGLPPPLDSHRAKREPDPDLNLTDLAGFVACIRKRGAEMIIGPDARDGTYALRLLLAAAEDWLRMKATTQNTASLATPDRRSG